MTCLSRCRARESSFSYQIFNFPRYWQ